MSDHTQSPSSLVETALHGVRYMQGLNSEQVAEQLKSSGPGPFEVQLGDGSFFWTTADGKGAIEQLARQWRSASSKAKLHLNAKSAYERTCRNFGSMLEQFGSDGQDASVTDTASFHAELIRRLDGELDGNFTDVHFYFPCRVLKDISSGPIDVGPVQFLPLSDWLDRVDRQAAPKLLSWTAPLREFLSTPFMSVIERDQALEQLPEAAIRVFQALSHCEWMASVGLRAADPARAHDRAAAAARLAIDVLGLAMNRKAAAALRGPGDELRTREAHVLSQVRTGDVLESWSLDLPDSGGTREISRQYVKDTVNLRQWAGKAITSVIEPTHTAGAKEPSIAQRLCDAIFWFGEARRDRTEFMALVRYGMALDVMAKGSRRRGIITLVERLAGLKGSDKVLNGESLETLVGQIYDEGRSQFGHGGRAALIQDLPASIEAADVLTQQVIQLYAACSAHYTGEQKYASFLEAIPECLKEVSANSSALVKGQRHS